MCQSRIRLLVYLRIQPAAEIELTSNMSVRSVNPSSIWENVCQCAFCSELAVALAGESVHGHEDLDLALSYLGKVFARRIGG